ncbi:MAG: two-component system phosphate regulon sensor histidine kinase PhoR [Paraglaciecola psychrophila]|jgi:two-component system phosphate regulon sensor histidine kinase PhoR
MPTLNWKQDARELCLWMLVAGVLGWSVDLLPWSLLAACLVYIAWSALQLKKFYCWLQREENTVPVQSRGLWRSLFSGLYRLKKNHSEETAGLQKSVDYLQATFTSMEDAAVMIDSAGNIEWSNSAANTLLGVRYPQDQSQHISNLIRTPEFYQYFDGNNYQKPLQITSSVDDLHQLQISITAMAENRKLLLARDTTETNRLQQMRTDFVANVSHELRTPLTVIKGYLETLSEYGFSDDVVNMEDCQSKRMVQQMLCQSRRMEMLIEGLMTLARLESIADTDSREAIALLPMLSSIREEVLATVKDQRTIRIECKENTHLIGSPFELRSAFSNLVMNAAKYTAPGDEIVIRWQPRPHSAILTVEDNGEGIAHYHLPRLTERFYRVDKSRATNTGGAGLGLAIVKHILLRHGAKLTVSSTVGEGSKFHCEFPMSANYNERLAV